MFDSTLLAQLDEYRELVAPRLDEPVQAACVLTRRGMMTQKFAGHFGGGLPYLLAKKFFQRRAGGLPEVFILALTPTRAHAFAYKPARRRLGDEVAAWDRSSLTATWAQAGPMMLDVTLTAGDESVAVRVGDAEASRAFLRLMAPPLEQAA